MTDEITVTPATPTLPTASLPTAALSASDIIDQQINDLKIEKAAQSMVDTIKASIKEPVTSANLYVVVFEVMKEVDLIKNLTGSQKKQLAVNVVQKLANTTSDTALGHAIDMSINGMIEIAILASKSPQFNKLEKKCLTCCFRKAKK